MKHRIRYYFSDYISVTHFVNFAYPEQLFELIYLTDFIKKLIKKTDCFSTIPKSRDYEMSSESNSLPGGYKLALREPRIYFPTYDKFSNTVSSTNSLPNCSFFAIRVRNIETIFLLEWLKWIILYCVINCHVWPTKSVILKLKFYWL